MSTEPGEQSERGPASSEYAPSQHTDDRLDPLAVEVYAKATEHASISRLQLLHSASAPVSSASEAVRRLERLGLLIQRADDPEQLVPVAPATAYGPMLSRALRVLRVQDARIRQAYAQLSELLPVYQNSARGKSGKPVLHRFDSVFAAQEAIEELIETAGYDIVVSCVGAPRLEHLQARLEQPAIQALERGVTIGVIYPYAVQFHETVADRVRTLMRHGAQARVLHDGFTPLVIVDGKTALIGLADSDEGALLVQDAHIIRVLSDSFERVWSKTRPFPAVYDAQQILRGSEEVKTAIVELLAEGYDDKAAARRLAISLRTFQRHFAEILHRLGATNRFQAGYLIRDLRVLNELGTVPRRPCPLPDPPERE
jgi:DNA-binding NarL/FixJ family response regulator